MYRDFAYMFMLLNVKKSQNTKKKIRLTGISDSLKIKMGQIDPEHNTKEKHNTFKLKLVYLHYYLSTQKSRELRTCLHADLMSDTA